MPKSKVTGKVTATKSSKTLSNRSTGAKSKTAAASALSQTKVPNKTTSKSVASTASKELSDERSSNTSKSASGSALSQRERTLKSPAKIGTVKKSTVAKAVKTVSAKRTSNK